MEKKPTIIIITDSGALLVVLLTGCIFDVALKLS